MSLALKYPPRYTIKDYLRWEGDWELIEGIPYALASPSFKHQRIVGKIFRYLDEALEKECPNCVAGIDTDYIVSEDTVLRPDVFITCEKVEDKLLKPPKVIFEVISPSTREKDEKLKKELYEREGVLYLVLVYPDLKKARIYKLTERGYKKVFDAVRDKFTFELNGCKVELDFSKVWV
jgi:Uma2 family endonuclease